MLIFFFPSFPTESGFISFAPINLAANWYAPVSASMHLFISFVTSSLDLSVTLIESMHLQAPALSSSSNKFLGDFSFCWLKQLQQMQMVSIEVKIFFIV